MTANSGLTLIDRPTLLDGDDIESAWVWTPAPTPPADDEPTPAEREAQA
jgi:hypothetical protein